MSDTKDYKKLYENLSERISMLHKFTRLIDNDSHSEMGQGKINRSFVVKNLRAIAYGQNPPFTKSPYYQKELMFPLLPFNFTAR